MNFTAKIAIVLLCFSLCGAGTFVASTTCEKRQLQKTNMIPVENRDPVRRVWLQI
jgi:hypothetical protein